MNPLSTSSHNASSIVYASWAEYCKQNPIYLSSLGHEVESANFLGTGTGTMPDIIMPGIPEDCIDEYMLDRMTCKIKGAHYITQSGIKRMNQCLKAYPSIINDMATFEKVSMIDSSDCENLTHIESQLQRFSNEDENGESMDEEPNNLQTVSDQQFSIVKPKMKNKRIKCQRCKKGGHEDVTCLEKKYTENIYCHICHTNGDHDSLDCPIQDLRCQKCEFIGHETQDCRHGIIQLNLLSQRGWHNHEDSALHYSHERIIPPE